MPWRARAPQRPNPYHVLVSEAMLQQTQVATVEAYFRRFIARFPEVRALARATERQVLRQWQGLGYYRRARLLHGAAREIVARCGGRVPDTAAALRGLPGVGRYTAGAVASIAFGRRAAAVDGNVARVLARWAALDQPIDAPAGRAHLWTLADELVPVRRPGDFNQALMDLGATICVPRQPRCPSCPVARFCRARELGREGLLPVRSARRAPRAVAQHVLVVRRGTRVLLQKRPGHGMWAGMWQLPTAESLPAAAGSGRVVTWAAASLGLHITKPKQIGDFTHVTTHRRIRFVVWQATPRAAAARAMPGRAAALLWRDPRDVDDLPLPNPQRRVLALLRA
jgi:A/G-specific adenine glycosylase